MPVLWGTVALCQVSPEAQGTAFQTLPNRVVSPGSVLRKQGMPSPDATVFVFVYGTQVGISLCHLGFSDIVAQPAETGV